MKKTIYLTLFVILILFTQACELGNLTPLVGVPDTLKAEEGDPSLVAITPQDENSILISYPSEELTSAKLYISAGDSSGLILASSAMNYMDGSYETEVSHTTYTEGAQIKYVILTYQSGVESCIPQGALGDIDSWDTYTYGDLITTTESEDNTDPGDTAPEETDSERGYLIETESGDITLTDFESQSFTINYPRESEASWVRAYVSAGNSTGLILAAQELTYEEGSYKLTAEHSSFTEGSLIYLALIEYADGAETMLLGDSLGDITTWESITYTETPPELPTDSLDDEKEDPEYGEYQLVWEENFNGDSLDTDVWNTENAAGVWNWGDNQELQRYRTENVTVGADGEGNNALIITAKDESYDGYSYTSGRINTQGKVAAQFGRIEARIKLPPLANGLWPAFWMLGTEGGTWPACGEIDIMEAGHSEGIEAGTQERTFNGAVHWSHEGSYAGYGLQNTEPEGFSLQEYNTFTFEWTEDTLTMYVNDNTEPYYEFANYEDSEEFYSWPHYFVLNLAVGGSFPGITDSSGISAPLPANMYVDYIRVYRRSGEGTFVQEEPETPPVTDQYAILSENPTITESLGLDSMANNLYIWEDTLFTLDEAPPYEGSDVLALFSPGSNTWFGAGINSLNGLDLSTYQNGYLHFAARTSDDGELWVGVSDTNGSEAKITLGTSSGEASFSRDGQWQRVVVPVSSFTAAGIDMSLIDNAFMFGGSPNTTDICLDDIYFSVDSESLANSELNPDMNDPVPTLDLTITSEAYGIFSEDESLTDQLIIDDSTAHIYVWSSTMEEVETDAYEGEGVLSFSSDASQGWWGFGIHDDYAHDLSNFSQGNLTFQVKTTSSADFRIEIQGAEGSSGAVYLTTSENTFTRDGTWQEVTLPLSAFTSSGLDLSAVGVPFSAVGTSEMSDIAFDNIIYQK